jgi:hypothetical protein
MALTEDLGVFLADFGVSVSDGSTATTGLFDMPGEVVAGGQIISTDYMLTIKASDYPGLVYGSALIVDGANYVVRSVQPTDDGKFKQVFLQAS